MPQATIQLGHQGITENFLATLRTYFKNHHQVRVSVLQSLTRDKKELKQLSDDLLARLGLNYRARLLGYTIIINKFRRDVREA